MKVLYVAVLYHLRITTQLVDDLRISKTDLYITLKPQSVQRFLAAPEIKAAIGILEYEALVSGLPVIYSHREIGTIEEIKVGVIEFLRDIVSFCTATWASSDNSVNSEFAFGISTVDGRPAIHSNFNALRYCMANGKESELKLTKRELVATLDRLFPTVERESYRASQMRVNLVGKINRFERFTFHIQIARRERELALKINSYCVAFEALLSTSNSELAHQLAERVALLVAEGQRDRVEVYKLIKRIYSIRSSVAHGGSIKVSPEKMEELAVDADRVARWLYVGVVSDDQVYKIIMEMDPEQMNEYFIGKLFEGAKI